jgi:choline kinase
LSHISNKQETALILAAGVGRRLGDGHRGPKMLLRFGGETLVQRRLRSLQTLGVRRVSITVGFEAEAMRAAAAQAGFAGDIEFVDNPRYCEGSLVSLQVQGEALRNGPVLVMDGDVLHDSRMVARLWEGQAENTLLVDRELEPGDEPVKACFDTEGRLVDFRKVLERPGAWLGESVGFFRLSAAAARELADGCDAYVARGRGELEYEEALRDHMLAAPHRWGAVDVTDLPWTEIDFEADVVKARDQILPQLQEPLRCR